MLYPRKTNFSQSQSIGPRLIINSDESSNDVHTNPDLNPDLHDSYPVPIVLRAKRSQDFVQGMIKPFKDVLNNAPILFF